MGATERHRHGRTKPSQGDAVLIGFLGDLDNPDIASRAGEEPLNSASQSEIDDLDEANSDEVEAAETQSDLDLEQMAQNAILAASENEEPRIQASNSKDDRPRHVHPELQSPFIRPGRKLEVPVIMNQVDLSAIPDTDSLCNAMDEATAKKLELSVQDSFADCKQFENGISAKITSIGRVTADFSFANEKMAALKVSFYVFRKITTNVTLVLGRDFLDTTETLTKYKHRLRKRSNHLQLVPSLNSIGSSRRRFQCYFNSVLVSASADTGSDINLISPVYAIERGFSFQPLEIGDPVNVEVAGGSLLSLSGKVTADLYTLEAAAISSINPQAAEGYTTEPTAKRRRLSEPRQRSAKKCFYLLWNLPVPIVLGQQLLDSIDAFKYHTAAFVDIPQEDMYSDLKTIQVASRISRAIRSLRKSGSEASTQAMDAERDLIENDARENDRQEAAANEISRLKIMEASASNQTEKDLLKQQRENFIARNNENIAAYGEKRKRAQDEIANVLAAAAAP